MATVDTLLVQIQADMSDLKKQLNQAQRTVKKSTGSQKTDFITLGNTVKGVIGGVIAVQLVRFGAQMVQMASHVEEMRAKSSVVFGEFVSGVRTDLEEFGNAVGRSTFALEEMASSVQDTFVPLGFARGEAAKLSTNLTKLAVDVASFNNASDTETMDLFKSALVGNHEAVRRFGIVITETELKAELQRMGIEKNINLITAQEKVQARLNLIIAGTTDAQGDAERTSNSFANSMKALSAEFSEFMAEAITPLLPALAEMVRNLKDGIISTKQFLREIGLMSEIVDIIPIVDQMAKNVDTLKIKEKELEYQQELLNAIVKAGGNIFKLFTKENEKFGLSIMLGEDVVRKRINALKAEMAQINANKEIILLESDSRVKNANAIKEETKALLKKKEAQLGIVLPTERPDKNPNFINAVEAHAKEQEHLANILQSLTEIENEKINSDKKMFDLAQSLIPVQNKFKAETEALSFALIEGNISLDEYNLAMGELKQQMFETSEEGKVAIKAIDGMSDGLANSLVEAVETGKFSLKSLGNVVKEVMAEMARDFLKAQIRAMLLKAVIAGFGGGPSSSQFAGSGNLSGVGNYAGGGTVQGRKPILVGERGPEIFVPNTGGTIKNNMDSNNIGGGRTVVINQNVNFTTGVVPTVRAEVINMLPIIKRETMNAVADAKQRGGAFAQALGSN